MEVNDIIDVSGFITREIQSGAGLRLLPLLVFVRVATSVGITNNRPLAQV